MVSLLGYLPLPGLLICAALAIRQGGDGLRAAFILFPWSLGLTTWVLFDDLAAGAGNRLLITQVVAGVIYAAAAVLVIRGPGRRTGWLALIIGALIYLLVAIALSLPILAFYLLFPAYLPWLALLAGGPLVVGLRFDGYRAYHHLFFPPRRISLVAVVLLVVGLITPWISGGTLPTAPRTAIATQTANSTQAVIIDTDLSHDDYVALLYLLQQPQLDIQAITVVNGVVHVEPGLENLQRLLAMAGREDILIAAGPSTSLVGHNAFPNSWRSVLDSVLRPAFPKAATTVLATTASDLIRQQVAGSPAPVTLIALGPLTNVAQALADDPALAERLDTLVISGGAINVQDPSNPHAVSDWNLFVDPQAADLVFRSGAPLVLVPLDVTDPHGAGSILIGRGFADRLLATAHGPQSRLMAQLVKGWLLASPGAQAVPLWDAPVVAIAIDPAICTNWQALSIQIRLAPDQVAGLTVVEEDGQPNARVCLGADQAAFDVAYLALSQRR
jgi:inosine-uridine nucleoside N-ribohydrolase